MVVELRPGLATTLRPRMAAMIVRERRAKRAMSKLVQVPWEEVGVDLLYVSVVVGIAFNCNYNSIYNTKLVEVVKGSSNEHVYLTYAIV